MFLLDWIHQYHILCTQKVQGKTKPLISWFHSICIWVHIMSFFVELSMNEMTMDIITMDTCYSMMDGILGQLYLLIVNFTVIAMAAIICSWCVSIVWGAIHARCCCYRCTECFGFYQVGGLTCIDNTCSNNNWNPITLFFIWMLNDIQCHNLQQKSTNWLDKLTTWSWIMAWMSTFEAPSAMIHTSIIEMQVNTILLADLMPVYWNSNQQILL